MFCSNCGKEVDDKAFVCPNCGVRVGVSGQVANQTTELDGPIGGLGVLCFFVPLLGLILYILWNGTKPQKAAGAGKAALFGFILTFVFYFIIGVASAM